VSWIGWDRITRLHPGRVPCCHWPPCSRLRLRRTPPPLPRQRCAVGPVRTRLDNVPGPPRICCSRHNPGAQNPDRTDRSDVLHSRNSGYGSYGLLQCTLDGDDACRYIKSSAATTSGQCINDLKPGRTRVEMAPNRRLPESASPIPTTRMDGHGANDRNGSDNRICQASDPRAPVDSCGLEFAGSAVAGTAHTTPSPRPRPRKYCVPELVAPCRPRPYRAVWRCPQGREPCFPVMRWFEGMLDTGRTACCRAFRNLAGNAA
jgi:hypothetical protein